MKFASPVRPPQQPLVSCVEMTKKPELNDIALEFQIHTNYTAAQKYTTDS